MRTRQASNFLDTQAHSRNGAVDQPINPFQQRLFELPLDPVRELNKDSMLPVRAVTDLANS